MFKIQAKDIFSNVVVETNELFDFIIMNTATNQFSSAAIQYLFSLYDASFILTQAGSYSGAIKLTQTGGLRATYYKTVDF